MAGTLDLNNPNDMYGSTQTVGQYSTIIGSGSVDVITFGSNGNTVSISLLETLIGSAGTDFVTVNSQGIT